MPPDLATSLGKPPSSKPEACKLKAKIGYVDGTNGGTALEAPGPTTPLVLRSEPCENLFQEEPGRERKLEICSCEDFCFSDDTMVVFSGYIFCCLPFSVPHLAAFAASTVKRS